MEMERRTLSSVGENGTQDDLSMRRILAVTRSQCTTTGVANARRQVQQAQIDDFSLCHLKMIVKRHANKSTCEQRLLKASRISNWSRTSTRAV